jgi:hypothetical protein
MLLKIKCFSPHRRSLGFHPSSLPKLPFYAPSALPRKHDTPLKITVCTVPRGIDGLYKTSTYLMKGYEVTDS